MAKTREFTSTLTADQIEAGDPIDLLYVTLPWRKRDAGNEVECGDGVVLTSADGYYFIGDVEDVSTWEEGYDQEIGIALR